MEKNYIEIKFLFDFGGKLLIKHKCFILTILQIKLLMIIKQQIILSIYLKKNIHLHGDIPIMEHFVMIARRN